MVDSTANSAEDIKQSTEDKQVEITNVGFEETPSAAWVKKFPMCDKFLKVKWVDKKKKIGYSKYDLYQNGEKNGQMTALIYLNKYFPSSGYDVYKYSKNKKLEELFEFIKKGNIVGRDEQLQIKYENKVVTFWSTIPSNPVKATISDNRLNVCIVYPDEKLAWIVEGKKISKIYNEKTLNEKLKILKSVSPNVPVNHLKNYLSVDLNFDNKEDYFSQGVFYSVGEKYFNRKRKRLFFNFGVQYIEYVFPPFNSLCVKEYGSIYLTTDGKNYYLSNQCNLTELTKG